MDTKQHSIISPLCDNKKHPVKLPQPHLKKTLRYWEKCRRQELLRAWADGKHVIGVQKKTGFALFTQKKTEPIKKHSSFPWLLVWVSNIILSIKNVWEHTFKRNHFWLGKIHYDKKHSQTESFFKLTCILIISATSTCFWHVCIWYVWIYTFILLETEFEYT